MLFAVWLETTPLLVIDISVHLEYLHSYIHNHLEHFFGSHKAWEVCSSLNGLSSKEHLQHFLYYVPASRISESRPSPSEKCEYCMGVTCTNWGCQFQSILSRIHPTFKSIHCAVRIVIYVHQSCVFSMYVHEWWANIIILNRSYIHLLGHPSIIRVVWPVSPH